MDDFATTQSGWELQGKDRDEGRKYKGLLLFPMSDDIDIKRSRSQHPKVSNHAQLGLPEYPKYGVCRNKRNASGNHNTERVQHKQMLD